MAKTKFSLEYTIDTDKVEDFKTYFLKEHKMPVDSEGEDKYTFVEWLRLVLKRYAIGEVKQGKKNIDAETLNLSNIIE